MAKLLPDRNPDRCTACGQMHPGTFAHATATLKKKVIINGVIYEEGSHSLPADAYGVYKHAL